MRGFKALVAFKTQLAYKYGQVVYYCQGTGSYFTNNH